MARALGSEAPSDSLRPHVVTLTDGSVLRGRIVSQDDETVILESPALGRLILRRSDIESIEMGTLGRVRELWTLDPDYNSVMLGPTPETLPRGTAYFRSFELILLNFGVGVTDALNLSFGSVFPISADLFVVSGGFKYRVLSRETFPFGLAVAASGVYQEDTRLALASAIAGVGSRRRSLNVAVSRTFSTDESETFFIVSGDLQIANHSKILAEYGSSTSPLLDDEDFSGFVNIGFRLFGQGMSFSLTGFRPLMRDDDSDGFIAFPFAQFSKQW